MQRSFVKLSVMKTLKSLDFMYHGNFEMEASILELSELPSFEMDASISILPFRNYCDT